MCDYCIQHRIKYFSTKYLVVWNTSVDGIGREHFSITGSDLKKKEKLEVNSGTKFHKQCKKLPFLFQ
jgi:hypothetical protein